MRRRLFLVEDDLMFAQRARRAAARLRIEARSLTHAEAEARSWQADDVVLVQATIKPERQLALIETITGHRPPPILLAVTGHLETELRRRLKQMGARLAAHSAMDRALARALDLSDRDAPDADGDGHPQSRS